MEVTGKFEIYERWKSDSELRPIGAVPHQHLAHLLARAAARGNVEGIVRWEDRIDGQSVTVEVTYRDGRPNPEVRALLNGKTRGDVLGDDYEVVARAGLPNGWTEKEWADKLEELRCNPELARQQFPWLFKEEPATI